ncbi:MAG TPA: AAA family ATPase, partial [Thermoanaerobaculia bacterium]
MPPKRSRVVRTPPADHLPAALTPLLGRTRELDETTRLLAGTRLLTITGAGGSGKTRLALELARRAAAQFDDAVWVDLAPLSHPDLIAQQLMAALRLREIPNRDELDVVIESLRERAVLLVFDNCEHLVDACAAAAETILRSCPRAVILATTREALGIGGEQTWLVPPMIEAEAVQLFVERARSASPSFDAADHEATIAHICTRLDGIPLAIELAAARVKVMSVEQIAERLDDAFRLLTTGSRTLPRHRTIRETIDWSYRLLGEDEQVLLRRLAVFGGTFSLAAAESICGRDILELLLALVDKSLVQRSGSRYRLLETVRQFAAEKFEASGEKESLRERHTRWFLAEAEDAEPRLFAGASDPALIRAIDEDLGNLRAALEWCEEDPSRSEVELRMLYALRWYWFARGHFHEARRRADAALARAASVDPLLRARAALTAGNAAVWQADWKPLRSLMAEAVATFRNANDDRSLSAALVILGTGVAFGEGDAVAARRLLEEAEAAARRHGRDI